MSDKNKPVKNTLFHPSVTGSTYEDFAQHAVLLPAMEKPPPPVLEQHPEQIIFTPSTNLDNQVPLFDPSKVIQVAAPPSTSGSINSFRRSGLKRPTYAVVPGLTTAQQSLTPPLPPPAPSRVATLAAPSSSQSIPEFHQFKPIDPQPTSVVNQHSPLHLVMNAVPAAEAPLPTTTTTVPNKAYRPVYHHWFHEKGPDGRRFWVPFSMIDSLKLEEAFTSNDLDPERTIPTDGGRFDVNILRREKLPVYWNGSKAEVRRCSWFYKSNGDRKYVPYDENVAAKLEDEFKLAYDLNQWHKKVQLDNGDFVEFHGPDVMVLLPASTDSPSSPSQERPSVVKRGMDEFDIDQGESTQVDHLLFMIHGIGPACDLTFRPVEEVVDDFRSIAFQLTQAHYKSSCDAGKVNRVEVLPISWHGKLHSEETGVDEILKKITLESIPRLRKFTNDTILDVLFYTSPLYSQTIISTVGEELNRVYNLFKERNPSFGGGVSIGGHSLGSLIIFDLLTHQRTEEVNGEHSKISRRISHMMGALGAEQHINYPSLQFKPTAFFALGSPIGMFVTVRGLHTLGENFSLPTCPSFFNIFHPYDPVAYRIEALINPDLSKLQPVLIPHHKGRKRMHLELKETMARVGADLKQKVYDSMKNTWNSFYQLAMFHKSDQPSIEAEVNQNFQAHLDATPEEDETLVTDPVQELTDIPLGQLNKGRRIDYVLQEGPLEFINEYIFAITSHVCYWDSEDTVLMILKEIYSNLNIQVDNKIPQQTMTIERAPPSPKNQRQPDPTVAMSSIAADLLPPPPMSGFVKNP